MAYFGNNLWPILWPGHNQTCGPFCTGFRTDFEIGLGLISERLG